MNGRSYDVIIDNRDEWLWTILATTAKEFLYWRTLFFSLAYSLIYIFSWWQMVWNWFICTDGAVDFKTKNTSLNEQPIIANLQIGFSETVIL